MGSSQEHVRVRVGGGMGGCGASLRLKALPLLFLRALKPCIQGVTTSLDLLQAGHQGGHQGG